MGWALGVFLFAMCVGFWLAMTPPTIWPGIGAAVALIVVWLAYDSLGRE